VWVVHDVLEQKAVELCFGKWVGALLFDGVLGRNHHEAGIKRVILAIDRDRALLHGLQQGCLGLGWRAVDFVGQKHLGEDWPLGQDKAVVVEIEEVGADHVAGHQVRRELHAAEIQAQAGGKTAHDHGFGGAGHAFHQHMAVAQQGNQEQVDGGVLSDNSFLDLCLDVTGQFRNEFKIHRTSPVSIDDIAGPGRQDARLDACGEVGLT
jgi:hypothetical protein